jgi:hydroxylamine reductase (hybrid-cluster protein)
MTRCKITDCNYNGFSLSVSICAVEECNIKGNINIGMSEADWKAMTGRPLSNSTFMGNKGKVIGRIINYDMKKVFGGGETHKELKKRLKKMGDWERRDNKWSIDYSDTTKPDGKKSYSEMFEAIESIDEIERIDELDTSAKKITIWRNKEANIIDIVKKIEALGFIGEVKKVKKEDVK